MRLTQYLGELTSSLSRVRLILSIMYAVNHRRGISHLPADILEEISLFAMSTTWENMGEMVWYEGIRIPLVISHVCHRWRTTALSLGRLWTYIDPACPRLALHFLSHSKKAPLRVRWTQCPPTESQTIWLRSDAGRIQELVVNLGGHEINALLLFIGRSLPSLEKLHISNWEDTWECLHHVRIYLGLHTPRLHLLQLEYVLSSHDLP